MNARAKRIVSWSQRFFFAAGISALGYCAFAVATSRYYQASATQQFQQSAQEAGLRSSAMSKGPTPYSPLRVASGVAVVGRLDIPRLQLSAMVAEGASSQVLRLAVGHVPGTALPWQSGNVALAAHRDTFFRRLGELKPGDLIQVTTPGDTYKYRVTFTDVVTPDQTWVLESSSGDTLTLITCFPFHFIGSAPKRFVVRAHRLNEDAVVGAEQNQSLGEPDGVPIPEITDRPNTAFDLATRTLRSLTRPDSQTGGRRSGLPGCAVSDNRARGMRIGRLRSANAAHHVTLVSTLIPLREGEAIGHILNRVAIPIDFELVHAFGVIAGCRDGSKNRMTDINDKRGSGFAAKDV
jgi:sortase A